MSELALEQSVKVSPPTDVNIRVVAVTTTSQLIPLAEYATPGNPTGQMRLTFQADGADLYLCFTSNASGVVAAANTAAPGTSAGNALPGIKVPNGTSFTIHHTASLSLYLAVVGSASGYVRYWRSSRIGAS